MKKCWKILLTAAFIISLGGMIIGLMNFVKDSYLQYSYELYEDEGKDKKAEIKFAWWGEAERNRLTIQATDLFEEMYPEIKVDTEYQDYEGYHDKISVQLATSEAPDIFQFNPENLGTVVEREQVVPLEKFIQEGILNISSIPESNLYEGKYNGKLYGIPMSMQTFCMFYNKFLFDQAGVEYPKDDWTWKDYEETLYALKEGLPDGTYPSGDLRSAEITTISMIHQQGGAYLTLAGQFNFQEQIKRPLKLFQDYAEQGLIPPADITGSRSIDELFVNEKIALSASYNAMAYTLQANAKDAHAFGLAPIPESATGERLGSYVKGDLLFLINSESPYQKEAVMLLNEFINNPEIIEILGVSRGLPPSTAAQEMLEKEDGIEAEVFRLQRLAEMSNDVPEPRYINGWSDCVKAVDEITKQYSFQKITLDEAVESMELQFENILRPSPDQ